MKTQTDISKLLELREINNELDFEKALVADRKLRVLSKEDPKYKAIRKKLRDLTETYENKNWSSSSEITDEKIRESDLAELIIEKERQGQPLNSSKPCWVEIFHVFPLDVIIQFRSLEF